MKKQLLASAIIAAVVSSTGHAADNVTVGLKGSVGPASCTVTPSATDVALPDIKHDDLSDTASSGAKQYYQFTTKPKVTISFTCDSDTLAGMRYLAEPIGTNVAHSQRTGQDNYQFPMIDGDGLFRGAALINFTNANTNFTWVNDLGQSIIESTVSNYNDVAVPTKRNMQIAKETITSGLGTSHDIEVDGFYAGKEDYDPTKATQLFLNLGVELYY